MSSTISVQLDALDALAGDLAALAAELADDADACGSAARLLRIGLSFDEGLTAAAGAATWAALTRAVADAARGVAATLAAAVTAYRSAEEARAAPIARHRLEFVAVAW
jgi:hypothetical protein